MKVKRDNGERRESLVPYFVDSPTSGIRIIQYSIKLHCYPCPTHRVHTRTDGRCVVWDIDNIEKKEGK
jgi:hypothetical protein